MRTAVISLIAVLLVPVLYFHAQVLETFEVASIRHNTTWNTSGEGLAAAQPGGRFMAAGITLRRLLAGAYDGIEVVGGPSWVDTDRFDVDARAEGQRCWNRSRHGDESIGGDCSARDASSSPT
jgi:hypothetical protein